MEILKKNNDKFDFKVYWGCDLQTEHERYLTEQVFKRPVFVTDYPKEIKAFYMRQNDDGKTVAAADCLVPGIGELIGGSQREERLELLEGRIKELGMDPKDYWWYCDLRRYGSCRHAGYGLGFERMVMYLTGINNIRDVELHPRTCGQRGVLKLGTKIPDAISHREFFICFTNQSSHLFGQVLPGRICIPLGQSDSLHVSVQHLFRISDVFRRQSAQPGHHTGGI